MLETSNNTKGAAAAPAAGACNCQKPAPHYPEQVTGMYILAQSLHRLGLDDVYGLVGIPVTEVAYAMQKIGMRFYGFRFEQQAGMAAATHGYLTKTPGVLLTLSNYTPTYGPCPTLGGNTDEVLASLGYTAEQIASFKTNGTTAPMPKPAAAPAAK